MRRFETPSSSTFDPGAGVDDPSVWTDISDMWPTARGSYAVCDQYTASQGITATGDTLPTCYAVAFATVSGTIAYAVGGKIWEIGAAVSSVTDRTNAVSVGTAPHMAQLGNTTICAMGASKATVSATGGNFAALAGSPPKAEIALTVSGAVLLFNGDGGTAYTDGWWASDLYDATNWSTGEAANGRLFDTGGPILAAVSYKNQPYVFKEGSIYRGQYVGGVIKWAWECVSRDIGLGYSNQVTNTMKYAAVSTPHGIAFVSSFDQSTGNTRGVTISLYDGASPPVTLNPRTKLPSNSTPILIYDHATDMLCLAGGGNSYNQYFYNFASGAWGKSAAVTTTANGTMPVQGNSIAVARAYASIVPTRGRPILWGLSVGGNELKYYTPTLAATHGAATSAYVETSLSGRPDQQTLFSRLTPILNRRTNRSGGTPVVSLQYTTQTERHGGTSTGPTSVTESTQRARFDFNAASTYAKFKLTFADVSAEIDDVLIASQPAGTD